jgi:hypothetical protein
MTPRRPTALLLALATCLPAAACLDDGGPPPGQEGRVPPGREEVRQRALDWDAVNECLCPGWKLSKVRGLRELLDEQLRSRAESYGAQPRLEKPALKDLLVELKAYTEGGKLFDRSGREIRFLGEPSDAALFNDRVLREWGEKADHLSRQYHLIVIARLEW